jgi:hypothetical protein
VAVLTPSAFRQTQSQAVIWSLWMQILTFLQILRSRENKDLVTKNAFTDKRGLSSPTSTRRMELGWETLTSLKAAFISGSLTGDVLKG